MALATQNLCSCGQDALGEEPGSVAFQEESRGYSRSHFSAHIYLIKLTTAVLRANGKGT